MLDLQLCKVLLFDDTNYPCWLVLVPRRVRGPAVPLALAHPPPLPPAHTPLSPLPRGPVLTLGGVACQNGLREMHDLPEEEQLQLMREINRCSRTLQDLFSPAKMNVAAIGNMCNQLHIHVTCRIEEDPAWPGPCYGLPRTEFAPDALADMLARLRAALA